MQGNKRAHKPTHLKIGCCGEVVYYKNNQSSAYYGLARAIDVNGSVRKSFESVVSLALCGESCAQVHSYVQEGVT